MLLFVVIQAIDMFQAPFMTLHYPGILETEVSLHALIVRRFQKKLDLERKHNQS